MPETRVSPHALAAADDILELLKHQAGTRYATAIRRPSFHMQVAVAVQRQMDAAALARATQRGQS